MTFRMNSGATRLKLCVKVSKLLTRYKEEHLQAGDAVWIGNLQLWANSIQGSSDRGEL